MDNKDRQERLKYARMQRSIRTGAILLAIVLSIAALVNSCGLRQDIADLAAQIRAKKIAEAQANLQAIADAQAAQTPEPSPSPVIGERSVTLSFVGDCALGSDASANSGAFEQYYSQDGSYYFFQHVKSIFEGDDLTVANLTSTFSTSTNRSDTAEAFRADPSHTAILATGGIDAVSVANDHTHDYGNEGYVDTVAYLNIAEVGWFGYDSTLLTDVNGIWVGLIGVWEDQGQQDYTEYTDYVTQATEEIQSLRAEGAQIIVVEIHWGDYMALAPSSQQIATAHQLIDAGADLIIGHHPETLQSVELYHGKYIAYSLGTFLSCSSAPADYDTVILQQTFTMANGELQPEAALNLIPCSISSAEGRNTYCPTPAEDEEADRIMDKLYERSDAVDGGIRRETEA